MAGGATAALSATAAGNIAAVLPADPVVIALSADSVFLWTWGLALSLGLAAQILGLLVRRRSSLWAALCFVCGASLVCVAALLDRDPTLCVGQVLLLAGLLATMPKKKTG